MQGRRLNIVDLVILLLVIFGLIYVAGKFLPKSSSSATAARTMHAVFISQPVNTWQPFVSRMHSGVTVNAVLGGTAYPFGKLESAAVVPNKISAPNAQGTLVATTDPLSREIQLTITVQASGGTTGAYTVSGNPIYLGQQVEMEAGPVQLTGYIESINP